MIIVDDVKQTCSACPSQWEGVTRDGRVVYARYRWGWLSVGVGTDIGAAIVDETFGEQLGDGYDGVLSYAQLRAATKEAFSWPTEKV